MSRPCRRQGPIGPARPLSRPPSRLWGSEGGLSVIAAPGGHYGVAVPPSTGSAMPETRRPAGDTK
jgi:hypothetical protein